MAALCPACLASGGRTAARLNPGPLAGPARLGPCQPPRCCGELIAAPVDIPVGRVAVVADPFGNHLVLLDLSEGHYVTDSTGNVTGVLPQPEPPA